VWNLADNYFENGIEKPGIFMPKGTLVTKLEATADGVRVKPAALSDHAFVVAESMLEMRDTGAPTYARASPEFDLTPLLDADASAMSAMVRARVCAVGFMSSTGVRVHVLRCSLCGLRDS